jgi:N-acetyl-anhydromuramyl-L-alanine amidase AmpD
LRRDESRCTIGSVRRAAALLLPLVAAACASGAGRRGDAPERAPGFVVAAGKRVPVDVAVVTFRDAGGFDARAEHRWFEPGEVLPRAPATGCDTPHRATERRGGPPPRTLDALRERVTQFVMHYDVAVTSANCFRVLHDARGLSVHFLLDVDGTVYQTLDLATRARHAGANNDVSIGIEIAHPGAWDTRAGADRFYEDEGRRLVTPRALEPPPGGPFAPARPGWFEARLNGGDVHQRDFTEAQYVSLERLVGSLARSLPALRKGPPRGADGGVRRDVLPEQARTSTPGLLGHLHVSAGKVDPGPAFDWERLRNDAE